MKKIIALTVAVTVIISILNISAFAEGEAPAMTNQEYYASQSYLIAQFCDGSITYEEFQERSQAVTDQYVTSNTVGGVLRAGALTASQNISAISQKIGATVQKYGESARNYVSDWISDFFDEYSVLSQKPTTDLMGGGAKAVLTYPNGSEIVFTCSYIVVDTSDGYDKTRITIYSGDGQSYRYELQKDGTYKLTWQSGGSLQTTIQGNGTTVTDFGIVDKGGTVYKLYGDVRTIEGEKFPTDDEYVDFKDYDFTEIPETDLADLIGDVTEEFERQEPDLSTIEGLLRAIYARMGKLDSDNDNALLSAINASILKLINADKDNTDKDDSDNKNPDNEGNTNEELVNALLEIRDMIKEGNFGTSPEAHGHEISGTVYNVIPLDKNFLNKLLHDTTNLKVEYEGTVYYLEDCGCLKLGDKYYTPDFNYDSYALADYDLGNDNISLDDSEYLGFDAENPLDMYNKLSYTKRKKVDNIVNSIYQMVTYSIPYHAITLAFTPFEVIIFNTAVPEDIVLNFKGNDKVGSFSATILSVSFFQNQYVAAAMGIVKPFLTVVIGYCWLKVMRRKVVSM